MNESDVAPCPHCGNVTSQLLEGSFVSLHRPDGSHTYFLTRCSTCLEGLLYSVIDAQNRIQATTHGNFKLSKYKLVWPKPKELHSAIPERVRKIYSEALAVKGRAPNAFANQIRRALEAICNDRGATEGSLASRLQSLASKGDIPPTLVEMTEVLRKLGNIGSHADEEDVSPHYVEVIDEFFQAIIEYVYIGPKKIAIFKRHLEKVRSNDLL